MKKILCILITLTLFACQDDDSNMTETVADDPIGEVNFSVQRMEPTLGATTYTLDYRYDNNNNVTELYYEGLYDEPYYSYSYDQGGTLQSINFNVTPFFIDGVNYHGRIDVSQYNETNFKGNLNLYDINTDEFVVSYRTYEYEFEGSLIKNYSRLLIENNTTYSMTLEHDMDGRLMRMSEQTSSEPEIENWVFTEWTEQPVPLFDVLNFRSWSDFFPDKFISEYGVTQGAYRDESQRSFTYEYPQGDNGTLLYGWTVNNLVASMNITYLTY